MERAKPVGYRCTFYKCELRPSLTGEASMADDIGRIYTWAVISADILLSVALLFLVFWRGVAHPVLFIAAVVLPLVALGFHRGVQAARGVNLLVGVTLLSYFLAVNYYMIVVPSAQVLVTDMISVVTGTVFSIILVVLSLVCKSKGVE